MGLAVDLDLLSPGNGAYASSIMPSPGFAHERK